jgi:N-acetylglucosaminyldiphosphoundecaprenol N-acetyl-beta-D-mannosaminyltransferase
MKTITLFGQKFVSASLHSVIDLFTDYIEQKSPHMVCICNVHTTMMAYENKLSHQYLKKASISTMDGQPLVWLARFLGSHESERVAGPDLMEEVCRVSADRGYRHYFYGGAEGIPEKLKVIFEGKFPGIKIVGTHSPPFRPLTREEDKRVVKRINDARPDFLWVSLGAPKQEQWIADHLDKIEAPIQIGVGAAFDFFTGNVRRAPLWMQRAGLEWFFRLAREPKRLWKRYFIYNTMFLLCLIPEIIRHKFSNEHR